MMKLNDVYKQDDFIEFLEKDFLIGFKKSIRPVNTNSLVCINRAQYLGESKDLDLQVFEFVFKGSANKRVTLTRDAFSVMRSSAIYNALAIFHSADNKDWRFSLLTATPEPTENGKVSLTYSNPRRLSFFLGPNAKINTPTKFLISKGKIIDFEDLKNRFSIEVVNKEFYKEISQAFTKLVSGILKLPSSEDKNHTKLEFAVRLIGRIIFCWFLREKKSDAGLPLMPKDLISIEAVHGSKDYYHSFLEPIFFEVLNKPMKSRREEFVKKPFSSVPYLNGGLFSPQENDFYKRMNGDFQSKFQNTLVIPDSWLNSLFEILETYNFTIDENTSYDEELSIDPEMLGRIFENLLAEINPETGESARKATGSYYTPRTIVGYMIDESLLLYLKQKTNVSEDKLRAIISYDLSDDSQHSITQEEKKKIIDALEALKLLDPACGSGAFPIGALQKIVFILQQIDPDGQLWFKKQLIRTSPELRRVIEREFEHQNFDYIRKLGIIRENIYGVDIQSIATEISRLRCFLTLVVDEHIQDDTENRGIEPLPNLDFKFVTANSLIGLPKNDNPGQMVMFDDEKKIQELKIVRDQYFTASGIEREQLKAEFSKLQKDLIYELVQEHGFMSLFKAELTQKLTDWDPFSHKMSSWFDPEWMFGLKDGFDIVIANPPYINSREMSRGDNEDIRESIRSSYSWTRGSWDIYIAFFELGFKVLKDSGILIFITPDKWLSKPFGIKMRTSTLEYIYSLLKSGRNVFEDANVDSIVSLFTRSRANVIDIRVLEQERIQRVRSVSKSSLKFPFSFDQLFSKELDLITRIEHGSNTLSSLALCENACATDDAYKLKPLIHESSATRISSGSLMVINTGTLAKYYNKWGKQRMTYLGDKYLHPVVEKRDLLSLFAGRSYARRSLQPKLLIKGLNLLDVYLDIEGVVIPGIPTLVVVSKDIVNLKFILGLLNSKFPLFYFKQRYPSSSYNLGINFTPDMINNLPLPIISDSTKDAIISLVDKIHSITNQNDYITDLDKQALARESMEKIDQIVYKLYGFTEAEIGIVERK